MSSLKNFHRPKLFFSVIFHVNDEKKLSAVGIRSDLTSHRQKNMQNRYSFLNKSKLQGSQAAEHPTVFGSGDT